MLLKRMPATSRTVELHAGGFAGLLGPAVAVSMAYGVTLPLLPSLLARLIGPADAGEVARHTGWLTSVYTVAMFTLAPAWGALSDWIDRRLVVLVGLVGSAAALAAMDFVSSLAALYVVRLGSGAFSAAVLPAILASVVDLTAPRERSKRFAAVASATAAGFLIGPAVGSALSAMVGAPPANMRVGGLLMLDSPFLMVAIVALLAAAAVMTLPASTGRRPETPGAVQAGEDAPAIRRTLLLTSLVVFGITVAEVGITLLGTQALSLRPNVISAYFALCSLMMIAVQAWAYPWLLQRFGERPLLASAFLSMAVGLALLPAAASPWLLGVAVGLAAAGIGVLIPALAARISAAAGSRQGRALGQQTAAANVGQALAASLTGVLYAAAAPSAFLLAAAALAGGAWLVVRSRPTGCP